MPRVLSIKPAGSGQIAIRVEIALHVSVYDRLKARARAQKEPVGELIARVASEAVAFYGDEDPSQD